MGIAGKGPCINDSFRDVRVEPYPLSLMAKSGKWSDLHPGLLNTGDTRAGSLILSPCCTSISFIVSRRKFLDHFAIVRLRRVLA